MEAQRRGGRDPGWPAARAEMESAGRAPEGERPAIFARARDRLARLASRSPGTTGSTTGSAAARSRLGHVGPALEIWGRVPAGSPFAAAAALDGARLALAHGRLAVAEEKLARLAGEPGEVGKEAGRLADQVDLYLGRVRPISRRVERRWNSAADPVGQLRLHWLLDSQPMPVDPVREALGRFAAEAPEDDRVWLGRAKPRPAHGLARRGRLVALAVRGPPAGRPGGPPRAPGLGGRRKGAPDVAARGRGPRLPADRLEPDDVTRSRPAWPTSAATPRRRASPSNVAPASPPRRRRGVGPARRARRPRGPGRAWVRRMPAACGAEIDRTRDGYRMLMEAAQTRKVADLVGLGAGRRRTRPTTERARLVEPPDSARRAPTTPRPAPPSIAHQHSPAAGPATRDARRPDPAA